VGGHEYEWRKVKKKKRKMRKQMNC